MNLRDWWQRAGCRVRSSDDCHHRRKRLRSRRSPLIQDVAEMPAAPPLYSRHSVMRQCHGAAARGGPPFLHRPDGARRTWRPAQGSLGRLRRGPWRSGSRRWRAARYRRDRSCAGMVRREIAIDHLIAAMPCTYSRVSVSGIDSTNSSVRISFPPAQACAFSDCFQLIVPAAVI
jgi:hypothetical protein